jgi:hypothetical protein
LVLKDHFVEDNLLALEQVAAASGHISLVGSWTASKNALQCGGGLWQSHLAGHHKSPSQLQCVDERRYLRPEKRSA